MSALGGIKQSQEPQDVGTVTSPAGDTAGGGGSDGDAQLGMSRSGSWKEQQQWEPGIRHWPGMALPNSRVMPRGWTEGKGAFPTPTQEDEWC